MPEQSMVMRNDVQLGRATSSFAQHRSRKAEKALPRAGTGQVHTAMLQEYASTSTKKAYSWLLFLSPILPEQWESNIYSPTLRSLLLPFPGSLA